MLGIDRMKGSSREMIM